MLITDNYSQLKLLTENYNVLKVMSVEQTMHILDNAFSIPDKIRLSPTVYLYIDNTNGLINHIIITTIKGESNRCISAETINEKIFLTLVLEEALKETTEIISSFKKW